MSVQKCEECAILCRLENKDVGEGIYLFSKVESSCDRLASHGAYCQCNSFGIGCHVSRCLSTFEGTCCLHRQGRRVSMDKYGKGIERWPR
jgi:hypothetical protein